MRNGKMPDRFAPITGNTCLARSVRSPTSTRVSGLDVSPAVRDFLGMEDTDVTDWKFVDFDEVPSGPWASYGDNNTFVINRRAAENQVAAVKTNEKSAVD